MIVQNNRNDCTQNPWQTNKQIGITRTDPIPRIVVRPGTQNHRMISRIVHTDQGDRRNHDSINPHLFNIIKLLWSKRNPGINFLRI